MPRSIDCKGEFTEADEIDNAVKFNKKEGYNRSCEHISKLRESYNRFKSRSENIRAVNM